MKHTRKSLKLGQKYLAMQIARTDAGSGGKGHILGITNYQLSREKRDKETGQAMNDFIFNRMLQLTRHGNFPLILCKTINKNEEASKQAIELKKEAQQLCKSDKILVKRY